MTPPSKELLGAVLDEDLDMVAEINRAEIFIELHRNMIKVIVSNKRLVADCSRDAEYISINIYELMHLMKEWAWGKGFQLMSHRNYFNNKYAIQVHEKLYRHFEAESLEDTEIETVTKACEWILKEKGNE